MRRVLILVGTIAAWAVGLDAQVNKGIITYGEDKVIQISDSVAVQLDSTITYTSQGSAWDQHDKVNYRYDSESQLSEALTQVFSDGNWTDRKKTNYTYSEDGKTWSALDLDWTKDTQSWQNVARKDFSQTGSSNVVEILYQEWSDSTQWANIWQQQQTYNSSARLLAYETQQWNAEDNKWESYWDYNCGYDDDGNLIETNQKSFDNESNEWHDEWEAISEFDSGVKTSEQIIDYDLKSDAWDNVQRVQSDYEGSNEIVNQVEKWNVEESTWELAQKNTELYNNEGKEVENQLEYWDTQDESWQVNRKEVTTYDENGLKKETNVYVWDSTSDNWASQLKTEYYYSTVVSTDKDPSDGLPYLIVYPNPVESDMFIKFRGDDAKMLRIYDLRGAVMKEVQEPVAGQSINVANLKPGVYIAVLQLDGTVVDTKFVKK